MLRNFLYKFKRHKWKVLLTAGLAIFIFVATVNLWILGSTKNYIFEKITDVPQKQAALVLGALVYKNGTMSDSLADRVQTALELYQAGKVQKILISGDNSRTDYDEVSVGKDYLIRQGVPVGDVFLDYAGFDTYDSVYRAKAIFEVESIIICTQRFHLPRAVYIARSLSLDAIGMVADKHIYFGAIKSELREIPGRMKAFFNVKLKAKPRFLGEKVPITGVQLPITNDQ